MDNNIGYMICETAATASKKPLLIEERRNRVTVEVILQDLMIKNRNGRFYATEQMMPEIKGDRIKELLESGNLCGEAGHPMSKDIARQQTVDPRNISHKITKLWVDGNDILAHVRGTGTQIGEDFNNFILDGSIPSFSLRALGSIKNTARGAEVQNIKIITWDWVIYPSHKRAYMQGVVDESKGNITESGIITECCNPIKGGIITESGILNNSNKLIVQENDNGLLIPITNDKIIKCIKENSANVNSVLESFGCLFDEIYLLENKRQVQMTDKEGHTFIVNLESYLENAIMDYCYKF